MKPYERLARIRENTERMLKAREQTLPRKTSLFLVEHNLPRPGARRAPTIDAMNAMTAHFLK